ncbi:MAG: S1 RNA-binding domain-containing protein [Dehalococcoidia bacterium]|nr:S1 RNA-binding domain-containing protein [Dehalococcoidia bacterium]
MMPAGAYFDEVISGSENDNAENSIGDMAELFGNDGLGLRPYRRGEVIDGTVVRLDRDGILVDIGTKSEGMVPGHEVEALGVDVVSQMRVGDKILVYVVESASQEGQVLLSVDRARNESGWRTIQRHFESGDILEADIVDFNKGGLIANVGGFRGFVPSSQVVSVRLDLAANADALQDQLIGRTLRLKIIEVNRPRNRVILSERAALQEWRGQQRDRLLSELQPGQLRQGKVSSLCSFGAFIDLGGADGLVHLSELSWGRVDRPSDVLSVGDEVSVIVMGVDAESKKIGLSLRRARPEPWSNVAEKYQVGQSVTGTITRLTPFGAFARLEEGIEGLIHVSELSDQRIQHPKDVVEEGAVLRLKVVKVEPVRHRLGLSLKQAQQEDDEQA